MDMNTEAIFQLTFLFAVYSFMGWLIEVAYRSVIQRKFINAGFLYGPFIPIYGFGALFVIMLDHALTGWHFFPKLFAYGLVLTSVEYTVSFLFEKTFSLKLWDYSSNRFNVQGRVCLLFSTFWTAMALIFISFIHPTVSLLVDSIDGAYIRSASMVFVAYGTADLVYSVASLTEFRRKIAYLYSEYFNLSNLEVEKIFNSLQRLRNAFPNLNRYIEKNINNEIKDKISMLLTTVQRKIISNMMERKPLEAEFYRVIRDIYGHGEFLKLKQYYHHNSSIYDHVNEVAYLSYRICKYLKLDYRSATRGALLHDFFLYNWHDHDEPDLPRDKNHGIAHPRIALANAEKHFSLNDIERDIIKKHMWPLTLVPPRYKESFVVSFADKYLSSKEYIDEFKKNRVRRRVARPRKIRRTKKKLKAL
jgi:uncharacterized membrane protein/HD superfamily phosphodiesterase